MNDIYDSLETLITAGGYDLEDIIHRIDVMYSSAKLSEEERDQLSQLARDNSKPVFDVQQALTDITVRVQKLEERVTALEGEPVDKYPEYEEGHVYRQGDGITWSGNRYDMVLPGETTASPGTYPDAWKLLE